jgi:hypothetical protein
MLLALALALSGLAVLLSVHASAQTAPARKSRPAGKAAAATKASKESAEEKEEATEGETSEDVIRNLMERREAVQGRTLRGQTIAQAPPFKAVPRIDQLTYYPCSDCHADQEPNPKPRVLKDEHVDLDFQHGGGRFWCYTCHNARDMDHLRSLQGQPISFDEAYKLCGQCHFQRQKDWYFGGHGKRAGTFPDPRKIPVVHSEMDFSNRAKIGTWQSERVLLSCPACHNAHSPSIKPYQPSPPPEVRQGLKRPDVTSREVEPVWQALERERGAKP